MIEWSISGIVFWLFIRMNMFIFYGILGALFIALNYSMFKGHKLRMLKTFLYSFCFISFVVGAWELPLIWFTLPYGYIWTLNILLYMAPFPVLCILLKVNFDFGKKEKMLFVFLCLIAPVSFIINFFYNQYNPDLWNYGVSFVFRTLNYCILMTIFNRKFMEERQK